jgi:hypothetical protein
MNRFRKALLGAASLLALTASGQKSAEAAISPSDMTGGDASAAGYPAYADPLFQLMKHTNGSFAPQAVDSALREMFVNPSPTQVRAIPTLLTSLAELGAPSDVIETSRNVLIDLITNAQNINVEVAETVLHELQQAKPGSFKLAASDNNRRRRRPPEIGQVPGGGAAPAASSDVRVKHDITLLGRIDNGLGLYRFSYIGSKKAYVGVMAQEVESVMPEAVERGSDGYLRVYYDKLGIRMQTWEEWLASGQSGQATRH